MRILIGPGAGFLVLLQALAPVVSVAVFWDVVPAFLFVVVRGAAGAVVVAVRFAIARSAVAVERLVAFASALAYFH